MKQRLLFLMLQIITINYAQVSLVKDINPGTSSSMPSYNITRIAYKNELLFAANDGTYGIELWKTDGNTSNTLLVRNLNAFDSNPNAFMYFSALDKIVFTADNYPSPTQQNYEPYYTDGTFAGTQMIVEVFGSGSNGSVPYYFTEFNGNLIFSAIGTNSGRELFIIDGTTSGSSLIKDIFPGSQNSSPKNLTIFNNKVYFTAHNGTNGIELWSTDGTTNGTSLKTDLNPSTTDSSPEELTIFNNELYFSADDGTNGRELFKLNNQNNVVLAANINASSNNSNPENLIVYNNRLYFSADNGTDGKELWVTYEGTNSNKSVVNTVTQMVKNINPSGDSNVFDFFVFNGKLYFAATDGTNGKELWVTDGTCTGTVMLKNINANGDSNPTGYIVYYDELYFNADNVTNGKELWKTDGTANGTVLVADINTQGDSNPLDFAVANDRLFFSATTDAEGRELYKYEHPSLSTKQLDFDSVVLFPNPTKNVFTIKDDSIKGIEIYDVNGKKMKSFQASVLYDISELKTGIYLRKAYNSNGIKVGKIVKD